MSKTILGYADVTPGKQRFREGAGPNRGLLGGCGFTWLVNGLGLTGFWLEFNAVKLYVVTFLFVFKL